MNRRVTVCTLALALIGLGLPLTAQTVDEIIARNIEARGGLDALRAAKTVRMTGTMTMTGGAEAPFTMEQKRPDKVRLEFTLQGMTGIQAYDGESGWSVMPFLGKNDPEPLAEAELSQLQEQADMDGPLVDYREKGHSVELLGKESVEGTKTYKLKVTLASGNVRYIFLDSEHYLDIRHEGRQEIQGREFDIALVLGDYKEVAGIMTPFSIEQHIDGMGVAQSVAFSQVEVNVDIDDDRFLPPAPAEAAAD